MVIYEVSTIHEGQTIHSIVTFSPFLVRRLIEKGNKRMCLNEIGGISVVKKKVSVSLCKYLLSWIQDAFFSRGKETSKHLKYELFTRNRSYGESLGITAYFHLEGCKIKQVPQQLSLV